MAEHRILIDWGTTNARAYLCTPDGRVVEKRERALGILAVKGRFADAFASLVAGWPPPRAATPALLAGMIGSRQGWVEAPYAPCPATPEALARALQPVPGHPIHIVPGVHFSGAAGHAGHDVMRGEEVQIFGAVPEGGDALVCLPGTHSKWALVEGGRLTRFATAMTGEVFDALTHHTILAALMPEPPPHPPPEACDADAVRAGVRRAGAPGGLLAHLFSVRADALFGEAPALADYLAGILIGHEIAGLRPLFAGPARVTLVGAQALVARYRIALAAAGMDADEIDAGEASVRGLMRVLRARAAVSAAP